MTNQEEFKQDATELFNKLQSFKKKHMSRFDSAKSNSPFNAVERELRMMLYVVRTDEENKQQSERDCLC